MIQIERPIADSEDVSGVVARRGRGQGPYRYAWSPYEAIEALLHLAVGGLVKVLVRGVLDQ